MTYKDSLRQEAERKIESIRKREDMTEEEKHYAMEKIWENYNDTVRKFNKGEM